MASAKRQAQSYLGNENDYINLKGLNEERQLANDVYKTNTNSFQNAYNDLLNTIASNRTKAKTDFGSGRSTVSENAYLQNRNNIADSSARGLGNGVTQLNKLGNRMETGRQFSDLANTYYNTLNELNANEKTYTNEYNTNMESARNTLNAALADVSAREKAGRNAYKAAVAQLAEQIQARRDAAAAASAQLKLQKEQYKQNQYLTLVEALRSALGDDKGVTNVGKVATDYSKLISQYLGKNIGRSDAMKWMYEQGLYDPNMFTSSSKTTKNTSTNSKSTNNKPINRFDNTTFGNRIRKTTTNTNKRTNNTTFGNRIRK